MSNGNSGFTKIYNSNNQFSTLTAGDINASNVDATIINGEQWVTVVGYTPTSFSTLAGAGTVALLTVPNGTDATVVTDARLLTLPVGAVLQRITVTNNGTTVAGTTTKIGVGGFVNTAPFTPAVASPAMLVDATPGNASAGLSRDLSFVADDAKGIALVNAVPANSGLANTRVVATRLVGLSTDGTITSGNLKVVITYSILPGI